jgi:hypothetical protein
MLHLLVASHRHRDKENKEEAKHDPFAKIAEYRKHSKRSLHATALHWGIVYSSQFVVRTSF